MIGFGVSFFGVWVAGGDASGVGVVGEVVGPGVACLGAGAGGALGVGVVLVGVLRDLLIEVESDAVGHAGDGITAGFVGPFRFLDEGGAGFVEAVRSGVFRDRYGFGFLRCGFGSAAGTAATVGFALQC